MRVAQWIAIVGVECWVSGDGGVDLSALFVQPKAKQVLQRSFQCVGLVVQHSHNVVANFGISREWEG